MLHTIRASVYAAAGFLLLTPGITAAADKYKLEEPVDDIRIYGVGTRIDIKGKVHFQKGLSLPQVVSASISYRERRLLGPGSEAEALRSVREYETAEAEIVVESTRTATRLSEGLKLIVAQGRIDGVELYSLNGLLTSDELNLIRSPADSLALISLLPAKEVSVGDDWTVPGWVFQMLTSVDAVVKGDLTCTLDAVESGIARVKFQGTLEGADDGASTEVKVSGNFGYHLEKKYIADADLSQSETRAIGPLSPGLEIVARIRMLRQPGTAPGKLADQKVIDAGASEPVEAAKNLKFESPWNITLLHSRNWHVGTVDDKVAKFRLFEAGNLVAQCDMAAISAVKPGEHLSEQVFLADIRQSLGDRLRSLTPGEVIPSADRKFIYKVVAEGVIGDRKITWIFYLVADPSGRQASLMFTTDTPLIETLVKYDRTLVESIKFGPAPATRAAGR